MNVYNKDGKLSNYGLSCGYKDKSISESLEVSLTKEGNVYFVTLYDLKNKSLIDIYPFDKLSVARKFEKYALNNTHIYIK